MPSTCLRSAWHIVSAQQISVIIFTSLFLLNSREYFCCKLYNPTFNWALPGSEIFAIFSTARLFSPQWCCEQVEGRPCMWSFICSVAPQAYSNRLVSAYRLIGIIFSRMNYIWPPWVFHSCVCEYLKKCPGHVCYFPPIVWPMRRWPWAQSWNIQISRGHARSQAFQSPCTTSFFHLLLEHHLITQ